jgi:hypothetical protein
MPLRTMTVAPVCRLFRRRKSRHTSITTAIEKGQQDGVGLDQIRYFSRHRTLATMLIYRDEHDKAATQRTLADVVAKTLTDGA